MPYTRLGLQRRRATSQALRLRLCATMAVADILALVTAFLAALVFQNLDDNWFAILFVTVPIYLGAAMNSGAYAVTALRHRDCGRVAALQALVFTFGALFLISYFFRIEQRLPRSTLLLTMIVATALVVLVRYSIAIVVRQRWRDALVMEMVVLDDVQPSLRASLIQVDAKQAGIAPDLRDPMMLNRFAELVRGVDRVVVACPAKRRKEWAMMLKGANVLGEIMVDDIADIGAFSFGRIDGHETRDEAPEQRAGDNERRDGGDDAEQQGAAGVGVDGLDRGDGAGVRRHETVEHRQAGEGRDADEQHRLLRAARDRQDDRDEQDDADLEEHRQADDRGDERHHPRQCAALTPPTSLSTIALPPPESASS